MAGLHNAAVMAIHDRLDPSLMCRHSVRVQQLLGGALDVFILEDAGNDDTAEAIVVCHPHVRMQHRLRGPAIAAGINAHRVEGRP